MNRTRLAQGLLQTRVLLVNVWKEINFTIPLHHRSAVGDQNRYGFVQAYRARAAGGHGGFDAFPGPFGLVAQHELSQFNGVFDADAAMAEIASRARKQCSRRRMVQVDVLIVGKNELDVAQRVERTRALPDSPLAAANVGDALLAQLTHHLAVARHELEALPIEIRRITLQTGQGFPARDRWRHIPVRAELDESHLFKKYGGFRIERAPDHHPHFQIQL